ncbi:facilitated trehalose transporter Tret1-like isoform X1 [Coccinella septempunctata]|uniref:facilitated trehalose transporter Tret1-like isoform X1 n=1 Tax=Coccinella septempunctata TaxID=41139 RepID=UPI001D08B03F|nr:facilitated trehalose transporter Tret1-like isoform X1 [Coccinella septempunctata]
MEKMSRMLNCFRSINYVYLVVLSGNFLALTGDSSTSWSSPMIPKFQSNDSSINPLNRPITTDETSWIGCLNSMGAMFGLYPLGLLSDYIGRKSTLLILGVPHLTAFLIYSMSHNIHLFYIGRFLNGISVGAGYVVFPMYIAEISSDSNRGLLLASYTVFSSFGGLLSFLAGPYLSVFWFNLFLAVFPLTFLVTFYIIAPESPYYYVQKNKFDSAKRTVSLLRPNLDEEKIIDEIASFKHYLDSSHKEDFLKTLRTKAALNGSLIAITLSSFQQFSGEAAFMAYNETIFKNAGIIIEPYVASILVGTVFFISSFIGVVLVDRKGRKFLMYCSCCGLVVSELTLAVYYLFQEDGVDVTSVSFLPVFCLMLFMFMYNVGVGPLPLTITSEILPMNVKFLVATTGGFFSWMASFFVTKFFDDINDQLKKSGTIFLFCGCCMFLLLFTIFCVPETKGKSLHTIQKKMENK